MHATSPLAARRSFSQTQTGGLAFVLQLHANAQQSQQFVEEAAFRRAPGTAPRT
jgi:hypothetical protein